MSQKSLLKYFKKTSEPLPSIRKPAGSKASFQPKKRPVGRPRKNPAPNPDSSQAQGPINETNSSEGTTDRRESLSGGTTNKRGREEDAEQCKQVARL